MKPFLQRSIVSLFLCLVIPGGVVTAWSQEEPVDSEPSPVVLKNVELELRALPGSSSTWAKIVVNFESKPTWADGVVFSADVLLKEGERFRVTNGIVRYANIPAGMQRAFLYMSPSALRRFGEPVAIRVVALYKDNEVGQIQWEKPGEKVQDNWSDFSRYAGIVTDLLSTPWIMLDYDKAPDVRSRR
jgi:hypothetical protein